MSDKFNEGYESAMKHITERKKKGSDNSDILNVELFELLKHEREVHQTSNSTEHKQIEQRMIERLNQYSARDLERTKEMIRDHYAGHKEDFKNLLPDEHHDDHRTVRFLRDSASNFMIGLFGALGKIVLLLILLGLCLQIISVGGI